METDNSALDSSSYAALQLITEALIIKSKDAVAPLSGAIYSSLQVYSNDDKLLIHAGANIDPSSIELLKSRKHRNCAEKQAAISAASLDLVSNSEMRIMFLYRAQDQKLKAEKLLPCIDCYETYIPELIKNKGKLVLILDDNSARTFINDASYDNSIKTLENSDSKNESNNIHYKIIDAAAMQNLNIEKVLGARVCAESQ
ncbi:MAG: hypothetical protein O3C63_05870 [Cyanobacteria bacterium]|nr:hypothetical protein [Cyanobacteriota bacterium]MDA1020819.1 hypothetical protein [Cyanobacteriota bacterium]